MPQQFLVNNTDFSAFLEQKTWTVQQEWSRQGDTAEFYLVDEHPDSPVGLSYTIPPLAQVKLLDPTLGTTVFAGVVSQPDLKWEGPNLNKWHLSCRDWTFLADMTVVVGDFVGQTADSIIKTLVAQFPCGLTTNNVQSGPVISRAKLKHQSLAQALKNIEQLASNIGAAYGYYVDENQDLHFYNQNQAVSSGVTFTDAAVASTATLGHYDRNWQYYWDATSVRNDVFVRGGDLSLAQTDTFLGDGTSTIFLMSYVPDTANLAASITVAGVAKTVGLDSGTTPNTQWVITKSPTMLGIGRWVLKIGTDTVPTAGQQIVLSYNRQQPNQTRVQDLPSVAQFASLPNGGHFQMYLSDPTLLNLLAAKDRGERELAEYGIAQERVMFETTEDWPGHIRAGTTFQFVNSFLPDSKNGYLPGVNATYLAIRNEISGMPGINRRYKITGVRIS